MRPEFVTYLAAMRAAISEKVDIDTISPTNVGEDGFADLVEILDVQIYNPSLFFGVTAPTAAQGSDNDFYVQFGTNEVFSFKKISGAWVSTGGADFGITFPDGNFTVRTSLASGTTTATAGFWYLNNNQYSKTTQSQFTASTADNTLETQDLIYGTTSNTILYINGTPGLGQPALPANSVLIDVVVVPSVASGADPYLVYGQTQEGTPATGRIEIDATADGDGMVDLSANTTIPAYPAMVAYQSNNSVAGAQFDNTTKFAYGLNPSEAVKLIFIG